MQGMTLEKILQATGGTYYGPERKREKPVSMITIDSRQVETDCLFVAIKGARVDGNAFVQPSYQAGALCCLSEQAPETEQHPYIVVDSCYQALKDMAKLYRSQLNVKMIGITGSVGKTSTKEMLAAVLSERFRTIKTNGNFNNEVGVPLTMFRIRQEHEVAIVEMGISDFGEMTRLTQIVRPDSCVITNIGQCHLENLGDRNGVLRAKTEIFTSMRPDGTAYLNGEDDKLVSVAFSDGRVRAAFGEGPQADFAADGQKDQRQIVFFGNQKQGGVYAVSVKNLGIRGTRCRIRSSQAEFEVTIPVPGRHMVSNALAAAAVALDMGMTPEEICRGIEKFRPVGGHGSVIETGKFTILDDCYNANPVSMKAGIDVIAGSDGRRVAIIGDMFELGSGEEKMHYEIGEYAADAGLDLLICVGRLAKHCFEGAARLKHVYYFADRQEAAEQLVGLLQEGDTILVKASHGMHFEKIVAVLKEM
ncbi:MAG: UDP-N-acetylmuramoyl-tripeptide--D-alanyl-D-alanine ligase [Clostridiaceae bacterium]|nr:UDP-N-acetylmuramoyl-tripeptide--D-alanyl-D-alanine ligase [Clostridiaceae bacterium]